MQKGHILKSLRSLRAMVIHPPDNQGQELLAQLVRIGCKTETLWPAPKQFFDDVDLVFLEVSETVLRMAPSSLADSGMDRPTLVALTGYENPSVLQGLLDLQPDSVITKPLRPYGVLTSVVMARRIWLERKRLQARVAKLNVKIQNQQTLNRAKVVLMKLYNISEEEAYRRIRQQAMSKRATTVDIARSIIHAADILGDARSKNGGQ